MIWRVRSTCAVLTGVASAAFGCSDTGGGGAAHPVRLAVEIRPEGSSGTVRTTTVDCPPIGGGRRCERLGRMSARAFEPVPPGTICTEIYGGAATATVRGNLRGERVAAAFSLANGCQIDRWRRFAWLLGPPPRFRAP